MNLVWYWLCENKTTEQLAELEHNFLTPPVGYEGDLKGTGWDPEEMAQEFMGGLDDMEDLNEAEGVE